MISTGVHYVNRGTFIHPVDCRTSEILEVIKLGCDPTHVPPAISVGVEERGRIDLGTAVNDETDEGGFGAHLIYHCLLPPLTRHYATHYNLFT